MTKMKTPHGAVLTAALIVASLAAQGAFAEQTPTFPRERVQPVSCAEVHWNAMMLEQHPKLVDACREVVVTDGNKWARFETNFVRTHPDGLVEFEVLGRSGRPLESVTLMPASGQMAYIDGRATPFSRLRTSDSINLYVPENQYGFATKPGEVSLAAVEPAESESTGPAKESTSIAALESMPAVLPRTASVQPWLALWGSLALLSALSLTLLRRHRLALTGKPR